MIGDFRSSTDYNGSDLYPELMEEAGKHSTGKSCLYIKRLADMDTGILLELIDESLKHFETKYGPQES